MASRQSTVDFIIEQSAGAGPMTAKKMFGEYGLYCGGTLVGLVCDDQLFIKPTPEGRALLGEGVQEASPYPGAKPCFLLPADAWKDAERLAALVRATAANLPAASKKPSRRIPAKPRKTR